MPNVCKVCNKFLNEGKRSNAVYCGKRCKNKAVTLRKETSVLKRPQTPQIALPGEPLHNAPNIYELYQKGLNIQGQMVVQQRAIEQERERDKLKEKIRVFERQEQNRANEIGDKLFGIVEPLLFGFTNIIKNQQKDAKPQSGLGLFISSDDVII